ncbi:hypothetical protein UUU_06410 [Klebsiella pneumoniae subsp. pneumoniae DSM 30104 = JCM 1662 = NBRC 14940]|nr:hypothetical protein UUU_06410 [Klebsiella pneumoniae subsp. pneumoniae DSM 30104 = JCM 1662 = NBRC 14940]
MRGNRIGRYFTHHRPHAGNADDKDQPVSKDSENEVSNGAGGNHRRTLTDGFIVEGIVTHLRRHRFNTLIQHLDVAAQWDQGDDELCALLIHPPPQRFAEADRKTLNPDTAAARHPKMAKLMHRNQYAKRNDKSRQIPEHAQHITFRQIVLKTNSSRQAKTGTAAVRLSIRSRIPPCPGIKCPLSLMPASRLNILSVRSPSTEARAATTEQTSSTVGVTSRWAHTP